MRTPRNGLGDSQGSLTKGRTLPPFIQRFQQLNEDYNARLRAQQPPRPHYPCWKRWLIRALARWLEKLL